MARPTLKPKSALAQQITDSRESMKLTQSQLAKALGVHRVTVTNWETDQKEPSVKMLQAIRQITGQPITL